jgi:hypothetical protein
MPITESGKFLAFNGILAGDALAGDLFIGLRRENNGSIEITDVPRVKITFTGSGPKTNDSVITFAAPTSEVTVTGVAIYNTSMSRSGQGVDNALWIIPLTAGLLQQDPSKTLTTNTILKFPIGTISIDFS